MRDSRQAIIALGSNLGDRWAHLIQSLDLLGSSPGIRSVLPSPVYETDPVGVKDQPAFLNMVAGIETLLSPEDLMALLLATEQKLGRIRTTRWGPRIIDLDLLFYEGEKRHTSTLTLPHPRWSERSFVTIPLHDLLATPEFKQPVWEPLRRELAKLPPDPSVRKRHGSLP